MTYKELLASAKSVLLKYNKIDERDNDGPWDGDKLMAGFVGDVGDLSKIILAKSGHLNMKDIDDKLSHELADCLWSVLRLADHYGIDLEDKFLKSMSEIEDRLDKELA